MKRKYCTVCGQKLVNNGKPIKYNAKTGKPWYKWYCPTKICGHHGNHHIFLPHPDKRWWKFFMFDEQLQRAEYYIVRCIKCGYERYNWDDTMPW